MWLLGAKGQPPLAQLRSVPSRSVVARGRRAATSSPYTSNFVGVWLLGAKHTSSPNVAPFKFILCDGLALLVMVSHTSPIGVTRPIALTHTKHGAQRPEQGPKSPCWCWWVIRILGLYIQPIHNIGCEGESHDGLTLLVMPSASVCGFLEIGGIVPGLVAHSPQQNNNVGH